jgi:predicted translin family RNA/ssDNA-binding protein
VPIPASIMKLIKPMYDTINQRFDDIKPDLQGGYAYRYRKQISGAIQEYMEAVLVHHWLETQTILTFDEAKTKIADGIMLTEEDYLLGVFDFTGEVMRFTVTYLAKHGKLPGDKPFDQSALASMHTLRCRLEAMHLYGNRDLKGLGQKLKVARSSVNKIGNSVYSKSVRGQEKPDGWVPRSAAARRSSPEPEEED